MNYIERVNDGLRQPVRGVVIPPHVIDFALSQKQPPALADLPVPEALRDLDPDTQEIKMSRIVGNWSVRLALGSYIASTQDHTVQSLGDMEAPSREELIYSSLAEGDERPFIDFTDYDVRRALAVSKRARANRFKEVLSYLDVRPGKFPPGYWPPASFGNNDVTLTQAFGRNTFTDAELPIISHNRQLCDSDEEMFVSLSSESGFDPGASNEALADGIATQLADQNKIIEQAVQWEVAYALWQKYPELYTRRKEAIHALWPRKDAQAYRTFEVKEDSLAVMEKTGLYSAYEFAHPDMMIRALMILRKLGIEADVLAADIPFDEGSIQYQTRNARQWVVRESLARVEHVLRGRV